MWQLKEIELNRFGSHISTKHAFVQNKMFALTGRNHDDQGRSNRSGKSTLIEAVCWVLTGVSIKHGSSNHTNLIYNGSDSASVIVTLINASDALTVKRTVFQKGGSKIEIFENNEEVKHLTNVASANRYLLDKIGVAKDDLINYFFISKYTYNSFFTCSDAVKKAIIARFSGINLVDEALLILKTDHAVLSDRIIAKEKQVLQISTRLDVQRDNVKIAESQTPAMDEGEKDRLNKTIQTLQSEIEKLNLEYVGISHNAVDLQNKLVAAENNEHVLRSEIAQLGNTKAKLASAENMTTVQIDSDKRKIAGGVHCPNCDHHFSPDSNTESIDTIQKRLAVLETDRTRIATQIKALDAEVKAKFETLNKLQEETTKQRKEHNAKQDELRKNRASVASRNSLVEQAGKQLLQDDPMESVYIEKLRAQLPVLEAELATEQKNLNSLVTRDGKYKKAKQDFLEYKSDLANQFLKKIEIYANEYLFEMRSDIRVNIEPFRELSTGKEAEKIDVTVTTRDYENGSFFSLSGFERSIVELAGVLAFQRIINQNSSAGLSFLALDEILESVDAAGMYQVAKTLNSIKKTGFMVTHAKTEGFQNVLVVEKRDGVSKIII